MNNGTQAKTKNRDIYQRINFLYQAAYQSLFMSPTDLTLCRYYVQMLKHVAKRLVLRLHPEMKRTICKKCSVILWSGITARVRHKSKGEKHTVVTCIECGSTKTFLWSKHDQLWINKMMLPTCS
ncbi:ribonuclease P protein subunit p21-like [Gigantopelta aegis]|uniref:ribonuclease P protein subunit p21-like n=1 Tax=Gigantopelta aegis TaxID=1735272 RepID=UPI001B88A57F|nr:ribonuclease P protein subunit p21-like [Gigantopelta aegis]